MPHVAMPQNAVPEQVASLIAQVRVAEVAPPRHSLRYNVPVQFCFARRFELQ